MSDTSSNDAKEPIEPANVGHLSLTKDNSDESSTPPKNLSDMPFDVVGMIIERSDYKEQLILRKTSKSLRALVDQQKPACKSLKVSCKFDSIICKYNDHCVAYVPSTITSRWRENYRLVSKTDYRQAAFDDLASILKNPKLQLGTFSFDSKYDVHYEEIDSLKYEDGRNWVSHNKFGSMQSILKSINHQIYVKECGIDVFSVGNAMSILPYLKPGVLEKITISESYDWREDSETIEQMARLEQWKQAKELELGSGFDEDFPVEHATHFKRFQFNEGFLYRDKLRRIRKYIWKHKNVEFCSILCHYVNMEDLRSMSRTKDSSSPDHHSIPNSGEYLELTLMKDRITIEKKKKQ